MRRFAFFIALLGLLGSGSSAHAGDSILRWWDAIGETLDAFAESRRAKPPTPIAVRWKARRIWSQSMPGRVLDMEVIPREGGDLLVLLSDTTLYFLDERRGLLDVRKELPMEGRVASIRPRDAIGMIDVASSAETQHLRVRSSLFEHGLEYLDSSTGYVRSSEFIGYSLCGGKVANAVVGRNYFDGASVGGEDALSINGPFYDAHCASIVNAEGAGERYMSYVGLDQALQIHCVEPVGECTQNNVSLADVGYAHRIADIDNDGRLEVITTAATVPGGGDAILVRSLFGEREVQRLEHRFAGSVTSIAVGDLDGDGSLEVIAVLRYQDRVNLWLLN